MTRTDRIEFSADTAAPPAVSVETAGGRLTLDLSALQSNYRLLATLAQPAACAAVVKADAYGIGAVRAVPALLAAGCRTFFVAQLDEAMAIAALLPDDAALYVLGGAHPGSEPAFIATGAMPVLNSLSQARRWQHFAEANGQPCPAALQIDSGMSRLGLAPDEVAPLAADAAFRRAVPLRLVMSHLACADTPDAAANPAQHDMFLAAADALPGVPRSLANSGGTMLGYGLDLARPGVALYGGAPSATAANPMYPVVALEAKVMQIRTIPPGVGVGYGLTYTATAPTRLATLAVGYADGLPRALSGRGAAYHGAQRLPIVGRVSMDSLSVDISALAPDALAEGDWLELIGPHQTIDALAADAGTIAYEILTSLGRRYAICVVGPDSSVKAQA